MSLDPAQDPHRSAARRNAAEQHRLRVAHEAEMIAEARAELDAGLGIDDDQLEVWLERLDRDPDAPVPAPRRGPAPGTSSA